jgi:uncharacterized RDD family membrane protein YckC
MAMQAQQAAEAARSKAERKAYGGFWLRFAAAMIDLVASFVLAGILLLLFKLVDMAVGRDVLTGDRFTSLALLAVAWLYDAGLTASNARATLGKLVLGLRVEDGDTRGRVSFLIASGRHFAKVVSVTLLLLGYVPMFWDSRRRALHDLAAGTVVVKRRG